MRDKSVTGFLLSSGEKQPLKAGTLCRDVFSNDDEQAPAYRVIGWWHLEKNGLPGLHSIQGLSAHRALVPSNESVAFLFGSPSEGTAVATVAAVARKKVHWKSVVHSLLGVSICPDTMYFATYSMVLALDLANGNLRFRVGHA